MLKSLGRQFDNDHTFLPRTHITQRVIEHKQTSTKASILCDSIEVVSLHARYISDRDIMMQISLAAPSGLC